VAATDLVTALRAGDTTALPEGELAAWTERQRWFASKARDVGEFHVLDVVAVRDGDPLVAIVVLEARFGAGTHELYQLPIGVRPQEEGWADGVICTGGGYVVYDALTDPAGNAAIAERLGANAEVAGPTGCVHMQWDPRFGHPGPAAETRLVSTEQSNSSVVFDDRFVLKVFRRLEPGTNPELEMLRFLSAHEFGNIAALAGWYGYTSELIDATLGIMQRFVVGARDGWELVLDALVGGDESLLGLLAELGAVTGRMHTSLASDSSDPDFAPEEPSDESVSLLTATIDEQIERLFLDLPELDALAPIAGRGEEVRDLLQSLSHTGVGGKLIRCHGDYHLAQTIYGAEGWTVLDFEGEPARPLLERRRKRSPLRDVAGMLRSFAYVASAVVILRHATVPPDWEASARERFLGGFLGEIDRALLPAGQAGMENLLAIFELERAIYELRYELNHRPEWVTVPVAGIVRLLEQELA